MRNRYTLPALLAAAAAAAPASAGDPPAAPREVRVGLLLPADGALALSASRGAAVAAEAEAGPAGAAPVRVLERRVRGPWGSEAKEVVDLVYGGGVAGLVTAPDRNGSHLASQVAAKARVPVVVCSGASALTRIPLPWVVRAVPGEREVLASLLGAAGPAGGRRLAVLAEEGREGARAAGEVRRAAVLAGWPEPATAVLGPCGEFRAAGAGPGEAGAAEVVLAAAPAGAAAPALRALRGAGWRGTILALPPGDPAAWAAAAGEAAEGALLPRPFDPGAAGAAAVFRRAFLARFGEEPDLAAAAAHDAVRMLVRAARSGDGTAESVRGALGSLPPLEGATGPVELDGRGERVGPVPLARVRGGALVPHPGTKERKP